MNGRQTIVGVLALFLTLGSAGSIAGEKEEEKICQLCGMDAAKSDTEFVLHCRTKPALHACCLNCARRLKKKLGDELKDITTLDFRERKQIPAAAAYYVGGSDRVPKGSMMPFVFAFASRGRAEEFKGRHGGSVHTFDEVLAQLEPPNRAADRVLPPAKHR